MGPYKISKQKGNRKVGYRHGTSPPASFCNMRALRRIGAFDLTRQLSNVYGFRQLRASAVHTGGTDSLKKR